MNDREVVTLPISLRAGEQLGIKQVVPMSDRNGAVNRAIPYPQSLHLLTYQCSDASTFLYPFMRISLSIQHSPNAPQ